MAGGIFEKKNYVGYADNLSTFNQARLFDALTCDNHCKIRNILEQSSRIYQRGKPLSGTDVPTISYRKSFGEVELRTAVAV